MSFLALCVKMREQTLRDLLRVAGVLNREDEKQSKEGESLEEYLFEAHRNVENLETIRAWAIKDLDGKVSLVHCISEFECSAEGIDNFLPNNLAHWGKRITLVISEMRLDADTRKRVEDAKKSRLRRSNNPED
ncbi:MAG: hypothetical protein A2827_00375 [Candidatus Spechtbacteria bacterium RIFCSPHIGHO2_01_FULL_43_30]|uniref:Uncharacterized protein n=1 Tax=Candidatus Spechtbacteria bacterium RIFCSPHIGHO2_01_FULL_43_30 TaxID=1802158 RepID=A0A1G2H8C6_9BACT|nr:MAG: hypothetical protein A2827_00375 [Candidatus Spechtbacteria bacterium RIFCSPHIGHO2_01_FULL_43_30]